MRSKKGEREEQRPIKGDVLMDKQTARRVRLVRWRRLIAGVAIVAIVAGSIGIYFSPLLRVQNVQIVGATAVSSEEVLGLARVGDQSMLNPDLSSAEKRIESIPIVQDAHLERRWPQTVRIEITERRGWALWKMGDANYIIDTEGVVLPGSAPIQNAPIIHDIMGSSRLVPGDHVDHDAVVLAQDLLQRVPERLSLNVTLLEYTPQHGIALLTNAGYRVVVGDSQNIDYKLAVWQAIEGRLGRETMAGHVLDLRFGDRPSFQ